MTTDDLKPGAVWVRKSDGQETTIISAESPLVFNGYVTHRAKRLTYTERWSFLRKYEPKEQGA